MNALFLFPPTITESALSAAADDSITTYGELLTHAGEVEVTLYVQHDHTPDVDDWGRDFIARSATVIGGLWFDRDDAMIGPYTRDGLRDLFGDAVIARWQAEAVA